MNSFLRASLVTLSINTLAVPSLAQNSRQADSQVRPTGTSRPLTGKERLGRKWMDEQRIDNCRVPADKRGPKPRSSLCSQAVTPR